MVFSFQPRALPHSGYDLSTPMTVASPESGNTSACQAAGLPEKQMDLPGLEDWTAIDAFLSPPPDSPSRRPTALRRSLISDMIAAPPARRPLPGAAFDAPPQPQRTPWRETHLALVEETHRAARLADDNARLRRENGMLSTALLQSQARLSELATVEKDYVQICHRSRRQHNHLTQLETTLDQLKAQLAMLRQQIAPSAEAGEAHLYFDELWSPGEPLSFRGDRYP